MLNYGYLTYQAERTMTQAEQRETDAQLGRLSAVFAQLLRLLTKPARALRRQPATSPRGRAGRRIEHAAGSAVITS
jgi:hypothetical protein